MKPFDPKELAARMKAVGLPVAEDGAEKMAAVFFGWSKESLEAMGGFYKSMGLPILEGVEKLAGEQINKINPGDNDPMG